MSSNGNSTLSLLCSAFGPFSTPYTVLGCNDLSTPTELRCAYRAAALQYHPDRLLLHPRMTTMTMDLRGRGRGRCPVPPSSSRQSPLRIRCSWTRDAVLTMIGQVRCLTTMMTMMVTTMIVLFPILARRKRVILWMSNNNIIVGRISSVLCLQCSPDLW